MRRERACQTRAQDGIEVNMAAVVAIALGGAAGSVLRYALAAWITYFARLGGSGTFVVNIAGAFGLGVFFGILEARYPSIPPVIRLGVATGIFGGFTTFSSFMADVVTHAEAGRLPIAIALFAATRILGIIAMVGGLAIGRAA